MVDAVDDVAVTEVRLLANGVVVAPDVLAPYALDWNTTLFADGTYTLVAEAEDSSGNIGSSQMFNVDVANGIADMAALGGTLRRGGVYRASAGDKNIIFKIDNFAKSGGPILSRLVVL